MVVRASRLAAQSLRVLPRKRLSRLMGRLADLSGPPALVHGAIDTFVRVYGVDMSEAVVPPGGFATFDAFFTRSLRSGARPVDPDEDVVLCPADGHLEAAGPIDIGATFRVKGRLYEVGELLGDEGAAARFDGGTFAVVYLAPADYHRVHAPVSGRVTAWRHIGGTLFPVNSVGVEHIPDLFVRNERVVVFQDSERHGPVATVLVGAIGVGRIGLGFADVLTNTGPDGEVVCYGEGAPVLGRGDELGVFHLGSTVLLLAGSDPRLSLQRRAGQTMRVGEALARREGR